MSTLEPMEIKLTGVAKRELDELPATTRQALVARLKEELGPSSLGTDPSVHLDELGVTVRVHSTGDGLPIVLYRVFDVDADGEDEVVVMTLVPRDEVQISASSTLPAESASDLISAPSTRSARIGHELLTKLNAVT